MLGLIESKLFETLMVLFDLILYIPSATFQLNRDGSSWVEPEMCLAQGPQPSDASEARTCGLSVSSQALYL